MSPIPSPTPLRRRLARLLFSPVGLLCGFVVLLIATCPGARGDDGLGLLSADLTAFAGVADVSVQPVAAPAKAMVSKPFARSTRFDRTTPSSARSATPAERAAAKDALPHTRKAVPLLVDPLLTDSPQASAGDLRPMTGPPVGIRSRFPGEKR